MNNEEILHEIVNEQVEANPAKPYKTYLAAASAFLTTLLITDIGLPIWVKAIITAAIAALAVFLVPNPLRVKRDAPAPFGANDDGDTPLF